MAKKSMINRDLKRKRLAEKYEERRSALRAVIKDEENFV